MYLRFTASKVFLFQSYIKIKLTHVSKYIWTEVGVVPFVFAMEIKSWYVLNFTIVFLAWTCGKTHGNLSLKYLSAAVGCLILMVIVYCERSKVMRQKVSSRAYRASCWGTYTRKKTHISKMKDICNMVPGKKKGLLSSHQSISVLNRPDPTRPGSNALWAFISW